MQTKQELWQAEKEVVDDLVDGLGMHIDEGIKDTVIALRLLGINTISSHEGKIDHYPVPYIDIASPESLELEDSWEKKQNELMLPEERLLREEIHDLYYENSWNEEGKEEREKRINEINDKLRHFDPIDETQLEELRSQAKIANSKEAEKITKLLNEFYTTRQPIEEARLVAHIWTAFDYTRIQSAGTEIQEQETDYKKIEERLKLFQEEMNAFTEFLKHKFFYNK